MDVDMEEENETSEALRQNLTCPVCQEIFSDPVLLPCSHSFCRVCLQRSWQVNKKCPVCRENFTVEQTITNRDLKNACETFVSHTNWTSPPKPSEFSCPYHRRPLELYCELDEAPVCVDCATHHGTHRLLSIKDGVPLCKSELNDKVEYFQRKIQSYEKTRQKLDDIIESIKKQARDAESQIKTEFEKLHNFLLAEENKRLETLNSEKENKMVAIQEKILRTEEDVKSLTEHINTLKKEMENEDLPFLMNFQKVKNQTYWKRSIPQIEQNCLLSMSDHVGCLGFNIWKSMKDFVQYYPVVLDPNTASPWLSVAPDLTSVRESQEPLSVPDNPERFDPSVFVLGTEGYNSGKHKWEVFVGENPKWIIGVCRKSVVRKRNFTVSYAAGVWAIRLSKERYTALTPEPTEISVKSPPVKIRVRLNLDKGEVSFYDGVAEKHLVSFSFQLEKGEMIYPFFGPGLQNTPMTILPGTVTLRM